MEYLNFCDKVKLKLQELVGETATVRIQKVIKNNNIVKYAAIITEKDSNISPSIYLENYYGDYINGQSLSDICRDIMQVHEKYRGGLTFNIENYFDYNFVKDKLYLKLINREKNEEFLKNIPYREIYDLALIAYVSLEEAQNGQATITVSDKNLEMWNVSKDDVFEAAFLNTSENTPPKLEKMTSLMRKLLKEKCFDMEMDETEEDIDRVIDMIEENEANVMYVLTNHNRMNGAYCMLYEEYLKKFAESIDSDLYILPSSIHEVLLMPMSCGISKKELECMVRSINSSDLSPGEVLSDNVYEFYRESGIRWEKSDE